MTNEELAILGAEWQKRLRLQDWVVEYKVERHYDLYGVSGKTYVTAELKKALVCVRDPIDDDPDPHYSNPTEVVLIHELLHLHLFSWVTEDKSLVKITKEVAIDSVAYALYNLKHGDSNG